MRNTSSLGNLLLCEHYRLWLLKLGQLHHQRVREALGPPLYIWSTVHGSGTTQPHTMLKTKRLRDSLVVLLPTYLYSFLAHIGFNAHRGKFCLLFCVRAVQCGDIPVCCPEGGNRPSSLFLLQFSQHANGGAAGPLYFPLEKQKRRAFTCLDL